MSVVRDRNEAIKAALESAYRCEVNVGGFSSPENVRLSFSHMPHALEGMDHIGMLTHIASHLKGIKITDAPEFTISLTIRKMP